MKSWIVAASAISAGVVLAFYDLRTDDTGVEVGLLLIAAVTLAAIEPRRWWLVALCVGLPIPVMEIVVAHASLPPAGVAVVVVAVIGALIGLAIGRAARVSPAR